MMRLRAFALALICVAAPSSRAQTGDVRGVVFADANGNGLRDRGERGLPGVVVSNQDAVVVTDSDGAFRVARGGTGIVFVSVPDGYRAVGSFWRHIADATSVTFALAASPAPREFSFVHASDTHIAPASVGRTRRLHSVVDSIHPAFLLVAGDLVRDALRVGEAEATGYYDLFLKETSAFATPVLTVPGNHENFGIETNKSHVDPAHPLFARAMYHHYLGPDYYSFTYGGIHFVALNTVDIDGQSYYGHVDSLQLAWLARDLAQTPRDMPVVTFDHIPLVSSFLQFSGYDSSSVAPSLITVKGQTVYRHTVSNAADVLAVLRARPHVLALGAHIHAGERVRYEINGVRTRFEQSAAVIGPSQVGPLTFPSGVTLYRVKDHTIDAGQFIPLDPPASATP